MELETFRPSDARYVLMQDEEVVGLARSGQSAATECLISRYRALVENKARAYYVMGADRDDVVQEGMIGLCKAIRDFRIDKLGKFRPFAELCVTRQIITAVKTATRQKHTPLNRYISFDRATRDDQSDAHLLEALPIGEAEILGSFGPNVRRLPFNFDETVRHILSDLEWGVLRRYLDGMSYLEMSTELSCHTKSIDNALQRVKRKIGSLLQD